MQVTHLPQERWISKLDKILLYYTFFQQEIALLALAQETLMAQERLGVQSLEAENKESLQLQLGTCYTTQALLQVVQEAQPLTAESSLTFVRMERVRCPLTLITPTR